MILAPPTPMFTILGNWMNQSYNAGMNFANRNATAPNTSKDVLMGYLAAVSGAVTVGLSLRWLLGGITKNMTGGKLLLMNSAVAYFATANANVLNTMVMRRIEMQKGIDFYDETGKEKLGVSSACAKSAVYQTAQTRVILPLAVFLLPGSIMYFLDRVKVMPKARGPKMLVEVLVVSLSLWLALPFSIAIFPQYGSLPVESIEEEFRNLRTSKGEQVKRVTFNKGL